MRHAVRDWHTWSKMRPTLNNKLWTRVGRNVLIGYSRTKIFSVSIGILLFRPWQPPRATVVTALLSSHLMTTFKIARFCQKCVNFVLFRVKWKKNTIRSTHLWFFFTYRVRFSLSWFLYEAPIHLLHFASFYECEYKNAISSASSGTFHGSNWILTYTELKLRRYAK